jgi:hypothetical protein
VTFEEKEMENPIGPVAGQSTAENDNKAVIHSQNESARFNWLLPFFGAIGFGLGFLISHAITWTMYDIAVNFFAHSGLGRSAGLNAEIIRGIVVGVLGGGLLGLAYKNKLHVLYFALSGAIGFSLAFAIVTSIDAEFVPNLGRSIMHLMGGPYSLSSFEVSLSHGLGAGMIVGAISGLVLGLASSYARIPSSLLLCIVGAIWFGNAFAFGNSLEYGARTQFDGYAGAIGGALFGITLAICMYLSNKYYKRKLAG